jgi:hypothetical protein
MKDFKHEDGTRCDGGFHCPRCGGHHFGTSGATDKDKSKWIVHCHGEYGPCQWEGPHSEYVSDD